MKKISEDNVRSTIRKSVNLPLAACSLKITLKDLYELMDRFEIDRSEVPKRKIDFAHGSKSYNKAPVVKDDGRDASTSVDPEERDYYYNLDFLCGTYHRMKNRKSNVQPFHALGYGEDE